jgi:hypothetical protein
MASRSRHSTAAVRRCQFCGSTDGIERHHVGGRQHLASFTVDLCRECHVRLTNALLQGRVDMRYTPDRHERLRRIVRAVAMLLWQATEETDK